MLRITGPLRIAEGKVTKSFRNSDIAFIQLPSINWSCIFFDIRSVDFLASAYILFKGDRLHFFEQQVFSICAMFNGTPDCWNSIAVCAAALMIASW